MAHLAAIVSDPACNKFPDDTRKINLEGSKKLYKLANEAGVQKFVFASTCSNNGMMDDPGAYVDRFEKMMCDITGAKYAIAYTGAKPVFADVDRDTMGLSPVKMKKFLESHFIKKNGSAVNEKTGKRLAACVPMHTFGMPYRIVEIRELCKAWNFPLIEDSAGTQYPDTLFWTVPNTARIHRKQNTNSTPYPRARRAHTCLAPGAAQRNPGIAMCITRKPEAANNGRPQHSIEGLLERSSKRIR